MSNDINPLALAGLLSAAGVDGSKPTVLTGEAANKLKSMLGISGDATEVHVMSSGLLGGGGDHDGGLKPMTVEECRSIWIDSVWTPAVGNIVNLRPEFACGIKYPSLGENVVVTRVLPRTIESDDEGRRGTAATYDIAVGFKSEGVGHDHYFEHVFDSRMFVKVGQIDMAE